MISQASLSTFNESRSNVDFIHLCLCVSESLTVNVYSRSASLYSTLILIMHEYVTFSLLQRCSTSDLTNSVTANTELMASKRMLSIVFSLHFVFYHSYSLQNFRPREILCQLLTGKASADRVALSGHRLNSENNTCLIHEHQFCLRL